MPSTCKTSSYPIDLKHLGRIEGLTLSSSTKPLVHYVGGLPYALPPIGPYRFRHPRPLPSQYRYGTKANPGRYEGSCSVCPQPGFRAPPDESLWDEDCLQLNIWIPAGDPPRGGWPVFVCIHGGWLQRGSPNHPKEALVPLLCESEFKAIVVQPAYRVNAFGFLASRELEAEAQRNGETHSNVGFWDQRLALEWIQTNISLFGGNSENITVAGHSAGSHSTFQQLSYDLFHSKSKPIIQRAVMWSNSPGFQPKHMPAKQEQFDELLRKLRIPLSLSAEEKLQRLRAVPVNQFVEVQDGMVHSEFRPITDGAFISKDLIQKINSGEFGRTMSERGVKLMNGECRDEHFVYQQWRTPSNSAVAVHERLCADYERATVSRLMDFYCGAGAQSEKALPNWCRDWPDLFGRIYANLQVHCLERGFMDKLVKGGLEFGKDVLRYRIDTRAKCVDAMFPPEWGVTHGTDMAIWYFGNGMGDGLTSEEKKAVMPFNAALAAFVKGDDVHVWKAKGVKQINRLNSEGKTDVWEDDSWDEGLQVWDLVNPSQVVIRAKL